MSTRMRAIHTAAWLLVGVAVSAQDAPKPRTVWDGVYTDAQAARAVGVFASTCSNCHSVTSEDGTRPLVGEKFWQSNSQKPLADLLAWVSKNMPNGNGGSLSAATYNDLLALILKSNGLPAGPSELAPDTIAGVQIVPKNGSSELPANTLVRIVGCLAKNGNDWVVTSATAPQRTEKTQPLPEDATRPLGDRTVTLKFVLTKLDPYVGQRVFVSGMLIGAGGVNGMNVAQVARVAETCQPAQ